MGGGSWFLPQLGEDASPRSLLGTHGLMSPNKQRSDEAKRASGLTKEHGDAEERRILSVVRSSCLPVPRSSCAPVQLLVLQHTR